MLQYPQFEHILDLNFPIEWQKKWGNFSQANTSTILY